MGEVVGGTFSQDESAGEQMMKGPGPLSAQLCLFEESGMPRVKSPGLDGNKLVMN